MALHISFALQLASCFFMTGVIWIIQLIHYPAFYSISESEFNVFHEKHSQALGWVAGPAMVLEAVTAALLMFHQDMFWTVNAVAVAILWWTTFFRSVPLHAKLATGKKEDMIELLVRTNRLRTFLWSTRALFLLIYWLLDLSTLVPA